MHLGIFFKNYISSKTYVLKDQTLYISLKKLTFVCDRKVKQRAFLTSILQTTMAPSWCYSTMQGHKSFLVFGILVILHIKSPVCL